MMQCIMDRARVWNEEDVWDNLGNSGTQEEYAAE